MGRPPKVTGLRSVGAQEVKDEAQTTLPDRKTGKFQFRSGAAAFILSLRRRRTSRGPDGELIEEAARTKLDNQIDWVKFENNYFETADPEIAEAIRSKPGYGVGREFWALEDERAATDKALEDEFRRRMAERPDIAERVLRQSEKTEFALPAPRE